MNDHGFEAAFGAEYRARQSRLAWKYLGLIALAVVAVTLLRTYLLLGGVWRLIDLVLPGIILLLDLYLAVLHGGQQRWMARRFRLTGRGIVVQGRRGKEELIPWSSIVTVDTGTLAGFGQRSVPVLRCFLSASAWEKFTPNLRQSAEKTSMQDYYKLRKECFTLEYTAKREQVFLSFLAQTGRDERNAPVEELTNSLEPDEEFEYTFDEASRNVWKVTYGGISCVAILFSIAIPITALLSGSDKDGLTGALAVGFIFIFFLLGLLWMEVPCGRWLYGKCRICREGIHLHAFRKNELVPWSSIMGIERKEMNIDKIAHTHVICCYRNLTGKTRLEHCPEEFRGPMYREFYNLRKDIVTIGYTKERMAKIRAFRRAALKKEQQLHEE